MVEGSPADSVKLAICELMPRPPDLIVSGINSGSNAGINVLYSGTVAAAIEGAFFKITSIAVSLELAEHFDYPHAARHARAGHREDPGEQAGQRLAFQRQPACALAGRAQGHPRRPHGPGPLRRGLRAPARPPRPYLLLDDLQSPYNLEGPETDVTSLCEGYITVTPLHFDLTRHDLIQRRCPVELGRMT